jgi:hypothetical protein
LNVAHKTTYKKYEGKTNNLLIEFIGYVNNFNKLQQFKASVQKPTTEFNELFNSLDKSACRSAEVVLAFLLQEGGTIQCEQPFRLLRLLVLCRLLFSSIPIDKNLKD